MSDTTLALSPDFAPAEKNTSAQKLSRPSLSYWQDAWIRLKKNKLALSSLALIILLLGFVLVGPVIWRMDPSSQDLLRVSEPPSLGKMAVVSPELGEFEEVIAPGIVDSPETAPTAALAAPATVEFIGVPALSGVRLKWAPVVGSDSYNVYRSEKEPVSGDFGALLGEVTGASHVSFQDQFSLEAKPYWYTVVPKYNNDESANVGTAKVELKPTIALDAASTIDPNATVGQTIRLPAHPLGTDYLGRDVLARLMTGGGVSLGIGFFAPLLSTLLGVFLGGISGFLGGKVDHWIMRITDFVLALPFLLFVILFKIAFGAGAGESGITAMLVALVVLSWTSPARLTRGQVLQLRESEFVQAARLLGARPVYLLIRHLLPNTLGVILVSLTFEIPRAIFTEAFLSFIGMGVTPPKASWGSMCDDGVKTFLTHPHEFFFPALFISVAVLAFNLLGDGLRDALDPRMRSVQ